MEHILDSVKNITSRWLRTQTPLLSNIEIGDDSLNVLTAHRFQMGDQILINNGSNEGIFRNVKDVIDCHTILLDEPVNNFIDMSTAIIEKTYNYYWLQHVYLGDVVNIPKFPAVVLEAKSKQSEWMTLGSTKEVYNLTATVYVDAAWAEEGYKWMLRAVKTLERGLKSNFYPLVGPYKVISLIADAKQGDKFLKVSDTSDLWFPALAHIEDPFQYHEIGIKKIIDKNTVELSAPLCRDFLMEFNPLLIWTTRHVFNSWPNSIEYGNVYKGSMLKAGKISWFAWEQELQNPHPGEPSIY